MTFSIIGLIDAIRGEILAIIGFGIFLIPATIWIVTNIALLAIVNGPARERAAARSET
jgi:galactitol-specific phosphotransferase system IIC component